MQWESLEGYIVKRKKAIDGLPINNSVSNALRHDRAIEYRLMNVTDHSY